MNTSLTRLLPRITLGVLTACAAGDKPGTDDTDTVDTVDTVDTDTVDTDSPADTDVTDTDPPFPAKPVLGAQIDRVGRPGITTALLGAFGSNETASGMLRDGYNADANPSGWTGSYKSSLENALAVWDGLDTQCGNQFLATMPGTVITYNNLGGVLADDKLYVNAAATTCSTFLAVELNASGESNMDCGGRTLDDDTTDVLYSLLITGSPTGVVPVAIEGLSERSGYQLDPIGNAEFKRVCARELSRFVGYVELPPVAAQKLLSALDAHIPKLVDGIRVSGDRIKPMLTFAGDIVSDLFDIGIEARLHEGKFPEGYAQDDITKRCHELGLGLVTGVVDKPVLDQLAVIAESHRLREQRPEDIIHIRMKIGEDGMEWQTSERSDGTIERKLIPE